MTLGDKLRLRLNRPNQISSQVGSNMTGRIETPKWAYGVTTVPSRRDDLLSRTLQSLKAAGFDTPHLFVDGDKHSDGASWEREFNVSVTVRGGLPIKTYGNWLLSIYELYIRNPQANRFAIFQDDMVTYKNLLQYLEKCEYPPSGYWNLFTTGSNSFGELRKIKMAAPADGFTGWYRANQLGRGAVALIMNLKCLQTLLGTSHMIERPTHATRSTKAVDGAIVTALNKEGWSEYVHFPTLVDHIGEKSSMGHPPHAPAIGFMGENVDATTFPIQETYHGLG